MIGSLAALLLFQLAGEAIVRALGLPVPGPVIGMALMVAALAVRGGPGEVLQATAQGLLKHLSLLFVPAGVGVMVHGARLGAEALAIGAAVIVSTVLTIAVGAWTFVVVARLLPADGEGA